MNKKAIPTVLLTLLLTSMLTFAFNIQPVKAQSRTWIVDNDLQEYPNADFTKIQDGVNAASSGDTIAVYPGTYTENIMINKDHLTVESVNGADKTIVQAADLNYPVFSAIDANNIKINGFAVPQHPNYGIYLWNSNYNTISDNSIRNTGGGGIVLGAYCDGNLISNNIIENNFYTNGIGLYAYSDENSILKNIIRNNGAGISLGSPVSLNTVSENVIEENDVDGIHFVGGSDNTISKNIIQKNGDYGIYLYGSSDNTVYHNNFIDNTRQVYVYPYAPPSTNIWDDGYPSGGNYWNDYTGVDDNGDDIGDRPYIIDDYNRDRYPLMKPWTPTPNAGIKITQPLEGEIRWIEAEPEPKMPDIQANVRVLGVEPDPTATTEFTWEAVIRYVDERPRDRDRNDVQRFGPVKLLGGSWNPDFHNIIAGGDLTIKVTAVIGGKTYEDSLTLGIKGKNPHKDSVKRILDTLILQLICYKESYPKWHQFDTSGLPIFGEPNGFGLMQLDYPEPTSQQIWSWLDNVQGGKALWREKLATSRNYVKRVQEANSDQKVPNLSPEQHERQAAYLYIGAGPELQFYYTWNRVTKQWEANPNAWQPSKAYADDAMNIKANVTAGNPPPDW